jgi:hypothetical protein
MNKSPNPFQNMSLDALLQLQEDTREQGRAHQRAHKMVGSYLTIINEAVRAKQAAELNPEGVIVTDHAIVRWLERVEGMNLEPVRAEIRRVINQGEYDPQADHNVMIDDKTNAVVITRRDRTAITVLNKLEDRIPEPGQLAVMKFLTEDE